MKESNRKRFRKLGYTFEEHLTDRKFGRRLRGNSKRVDDRYYTKVGRNVDKKETMRLIKEAINETLER